MEPIYVTKPFLPPLEEYTEIIRTVWDSGILTNNGPLHTELEQKLQAFLGVENVTLYTNGHLALEIALKALDLMPGGEVITTPFTFVSTAAAIVNQNLVPVFCDIRDDYVIDEKLIESCITDKTVAIMPVHVYGYPCNVEQIEAIAEKYKLKVIYDAAHAFGVEVNSRTIASYGDISMFSFHATKLYHTIEGGALAYNGNDLKSKATVYKNFGIASGDSIELIGLNAKMSEFQAAMGVLLLRHIDEIIDKRRAIHQQYIKLLRDIPGISVILPRGDVKMNYSYFPVLIESGRDKVFDYLADNNVFARKYFYPSISKVECYKKYLRGNPLTISETIAGKVMTLPIYPSLEPNQVEYICGLITKAL